MALTVISNFAANVAHRNLTATDMKASASLAKLSSGQRIVSAKDDAAALAIGSRIAAEVGALAQAGVNTGQASSMLQIADGSMARASELLIRMKALAVQAASGQLSDTERAILDTEYQALKNEINRIGADTEFNGTKLLSGGQAITFEGTGADALTGTNGVDAVRANGITFAGSATSATLDLWTTTNANGMYTISASAPNQEFSAAISSSAFTNDLLVTPQSLTLTSSNATVTGTITVELNTALDNTDALAVGDNNNTVSGTGDTSFTFKVGTGSIAAEDDLTFAIGSLVAISDSLATNIATAANADAASAEVTSAIDSLNTNRSTVGANQSRLDFAGANIATARENAEAARSQLLDLDVAAEMTKFTSSQVLMQAGVSMLAQANQLPQNLLRLFQ